MPQRFTRSLHRFIGEWLAPGMAKYKFGNPFKIFKPFFGIFFSLGAIKFAQILLPLLALPWLARKLDMGTFGILMYFSILPSIVETILNWGFSLGAVKEVAFSRERKNRQSSILGAVISAKIILACLCLAGAILLLPFIPYAGDYPMVYLLAILYGIARGFKPLWFYQGSGQDMKHMAVWEMIANVVILALVVVVITRPERWHYYFVFNFVCKGIVYAFLIWELTRIWPVRLSIKGAMRILRKTKTLFANALTGMIHGHTTKLILGYFLLPAEMGIFLAADKIIKAIADACEPVSQTIYPEICALRQGNCKQASQMLFWSFAVTAGLLLSAAILCWLTAPWLIPLALSDKYVEAIPVLNIMLIALPIMGINSVIGTQILVINGHERAFFLASVALAAISIPLSIYLPFAFGLQGAAALNILLSIFFFLELLWYGRKYRAASVSLTKAHHSV